MSRSMDNVLATAEGALRPRLSVWLAGRIDYDEYRCVAERLAWEVSEPGGRGPTLLLYEHEKLITLGRLASRRDVRLGDDQLARQGIALRFVGRGGGAVPHAPGQVAVSLFARLVDLGFGEHDVAAYVATFEEGLAAALSSLKCHPCRMPGVSGLFGSSGQLAALGISVRRGVVAHGGYVNVSTSPELFQQVRTSPAGSMGSIEADRRRRAHASEARAAIVEHVAAAFKAEVTSLQSGIPGGLPGRPGAALRGSALRSSSSRRGSRHVG
jgi:lipoyl(octanoyl) transferase